MSMSHVKSTRPRSARAWFFTVLATLSLLAAGMVAGASPASAATLNNGFTKLYFNYTTAGVNYVNLVGTGKLDGDKVLWKNVATAKDVATGLDVGVDALVTTNLTPGTTMSNYGDAPQGVAGDFRVRMDGVSAAGGFMAFTFAFYKAGTYGTSSQEQETLTNVQVTGKDVDISQFNAFDGVSGYSLGSPTRLTVTKTPANGWPANVVAQSPNIAGSDNPRDQVVASYASVTSTQIRMGVPAGGTMPAGFALTWQSEAFTPLGSTNQGATSTVNYDLNSGTGVAPSPVTGTFGATSGTVAYGSGFSRAGFIFTGWNTNPAGSGLAYPPGSALVLPAGTTTLYAQWLADSNPYPITYFDNGATSGAVPAAGSYTSGGPNYLVVGNTGTLTRTGYTFGNWNSKADGTGTAYAGGANYSTAATLNLYAVWIQNSYNIDYNGNGSTSGTDPATGTITPPATYTIVSNPYSRTGYTRNGWNTAADGTGTNYANGAVYSTAANLLLYSRWTPNSYSVIYNANGSTSGTAPVNGSYTNGTPYTVSANTGGLVGPLAAAFTGWNTAANGTGTSYPPGSSYTAVRSSSLTLFAQYAPLRWGITYNGNGSQSGTVPASGTYTTGAAAYTVANNTGSLARPGYTFSGWNTVADGSGTSYPALSSYSTSANATLYAQWTPITYNLTFDGNGSTGGSVPGAATYTTGNSPYVVADNTGTLTRTGYVFTGWNTLANGLGVPLVPGATYVPTGNQTLYAQWVPTTYVISYDGNGATAGVVPPNGGYTSGGTVYTVLGNTGSPALTRPGYTFAGWNSAANGSGTPYGPGTANLTYGSTADLTLYAQWTQNPSFAITYNVGSAPGVTGNAPAAGSYIDGGAAYTVVGNSGTPAVLSRPGYTFANWTTDPSGIGGTPYGPGTANTTYSTASALSLYPQWTADTFVIAYHANGADWGNVPPDGSFTTDGAPYTIEGNTGAPVLARTGYTFTGWNTAANGSGTAYGPLTLNPTYSGLANLALYAQWTANASYAITYNQGSAPGVTGDVPAAGSYVDGGAAYTVLGNAGTPAPLSRPGYTFANWTTDPSGVAGTLYGPGTANPTYATAAALNLYPQWTANASYAITYNQGSAPGVTGNVPAAGSYVDGGAAYTVLGNSGTPAPLSRPGYTFANWTTDPSGVAGTLYGPGTANPTYATAAALNLYPQWTANSYSITYQAGTGGSGAVPPPGTYTSGGVAYIVVGHGTLVRPGYTFTDWNTAANGSGTAYGVGSSYATLADLTLYAQWTQNPSFAITYNVGSDPGVTGNAPAAGSYITGGAAYTVVGNTGTPAVLSRPGYTFANWNTDPAGGGTAYGPGTANTTYSTAAALSLYPQWTPWASATLQVNVTGAQAGPLKNSPVEVYRVVGGVPEAVPYATGKSNASGAVTTKTGGSPLTLPPDTYRVKGKNPCGLALFVGWSADTVVASSNVSITVPVPPTIPCVVQSAAYTAGSKTLSWAAPVNDGGRSVTSYEVVYIAQSALPAGKWRMFSYNIAPGTTSLNLGSASCPVGTTCPAPFVPLTPGTNYQVRVYARNAQGRGIVKTVTGVVV